MWVIRVVVIVVAFALGWFAMDWVLTRPKTYNNTTAGYSYTYPGKWKKVDPNSFNMNITSGGLVSADFSVADGASESKATHVLFSGTMPSMGLDWATASSRWRQSFSNLSGIPAGMTITPPTFTDTTVGGKPALSVKMNLSAGGISWDMDVTMVQNGSNFIMLVFMDRKPAGTQEKFQEILKTVKFKT
jgi:hypothetical protein